MDEHTKVRMIEMVIELYEKEDVNEKDAIESIQRIIKE